MSQAYLFEIQLRIEHPTTVIEDKEYSVNYYLKNVGSQDYPSGEIKLRLKYPHWGEVFSVIHDWSLGQIDVGKEIPLKPKPIKAVAGPNVFIFLSIVSMQQGVPMKNVKLMDINGDQIITGTLVGYLRVKSKEELISGKNLQIAAFSLLVLIIAQIFGWVLQLWLSDRTCLQTVFSSGMVLASILTLLIVFGYLELGRM